MRDFTTARPVNTGDLTAPMTGAIPSAPIEEWARQYATLPASTVDIVNEELVGWLELARVTEFAAAALREAYEVVEVDAEEPYPSGPAMWEAVTRTGRIYVSTANCEHPIWEPSTNVDFRLVHDCHHLAQGASGCLFDWAGELAACGAHLDTLRGLPYARAALLTECVGQLAAVLDAGTFTGHVQRVGYLPLAGAVAGPARIDRVLERAAILYGRGQA